jgi:hypothetical protein
VQPGFKNGGCGGKLRQDCCRVECIPFFAPAEKAEQIAIGEGAKCLGAVVEVAQATSGEDGAAVFVAQTMERGKGDTVSTVEVTQNIKEFGFELRVGAAAHGLHRRIGAYSFRNSHFASSLGILVRARSVVTHRAPPVWLFLFGFARHGLFGLCLLFFSEFRVAGFPAVGDFRQELADVLDFSIGPEIYGDVARRDRLGDGDFSHAHVMAQCRVGYSQFPSRLA